MTYTLRDHEAAVWRNRPDADEDLYDAPIVEKWAPRKRTAFLLLAFPLAWAILGGIAWGLTCLLAWMGVPALVAVPGAAFLMCAGFVLLMWVRS